MLQEPGSRHVLETHECLDGRHGRGLHIPSAWARQENSGKLTRVRKADDLLPLAQQGIAQDIKALIPEDSSKCGKDSRRLIIRVANMVKQGSRCAADNLERTIDDFRKGNVRRIHGRRKERRCIRACAREAHDALIKRSARRCQLQKMRPASEPYAPKISGFRAASESRVHQCEFTLYLFECDRPTNRFKAQSLLWIMFFHIF